MSKHTPTSLNYFQFMIATKFSQFDEEDGNKESAKQYKKSADEAFERFKNEGNKKS